MFRTNTSLNGIARLVVLVAVFAVTASLVGCGDSPTAPRAGASPGSLTPRFTTSEDTLPDGTCRSGYVIVAGRCVPRQG